MDETFSHLSELRAREPRVAMATLVSTHGTTPKKEGAKLWVGEGGRILGSVTIGGCVDTRVVGEAEEVLREGAAKLLTMSLGDEDAWEMGLTCGGTVEVLVEPVELGEGEGDPVVAAYELVARELREGRAAVAVTPLAGARRARLVVLEDGTTAQTLGDPEIDAAARERALGLLRSGGDSTAATAGGGTALFFEVHAPPVTMVVVGAGHLAMPLVRLAHDVGLRTVVVDARERLATRERFPDADELRVGIPSEIVASIPITPKTLLVLVAHDYKFEVPVLRAVLRSRAPYIGMLGSRRRAAAVRELLAGDFTPEELDRIRAPIGLDIGAQSVPEIALSILAEAVAALRGRPGGAMRDRRREPAAPSAGSAAGA